MQPLFLWPFANIASARIFPVRIGEDVGNSPNRGFTLFYMGSCLLRISYTYARGFVWALVLLFALGVSRPAQADLGFAEVFEKHNDVMLLIDPIDGRILDANPAAAKFYGYTRERLRTLQIQQINQLTDDQVAQERALAQSEGRNYFIFRHQLADGTIRTVQVYSIPVNFEGRTALFSTVHDVSKERVLEADLWHYQTQLEEMVDRQTRAIKKNSFKYISLIGVGAGLMFALTLYLMLTLRKRKKAEKDLAVHYRSVMRLQNLATAPDRDFDSKVSELLEMGCEVFDMPLGIVSQIEGDSYTIMYACSPGGVLVPGTVYDLNKTYCVHTLKSEEPTGFANVGKSEISEHPCYKGFGLESYIGIRLTVGGKLYGTLNFSSLTPHPENFSRSEFTLIRLFADWVSNELARKAFETDIIEAKADADVASRAKSEFLASMSHELRTPLNSIIGFAEMMKFEVKGPLPAAYLEYTGLITKSGMLLLETVNSILDLAKIEADKFELYPEALFMAELVDDVFDLIKVIAAEKGIEVRNETSNLPQLVVDGVRTKQVLINLLSNAIKFTERGCVVLRNASDASGHSISIVDTGIGMTEDQVEVALMPFKQIHGNSLSRRYQGTGLGLSLSRNIMELQGGSLSVESEPGKGTTVTLHFPQNLDIASAQA